MKLRKREFPSQAVSDYEPEVRAQLQNGDVLICSGSGLFSAMIRQATRSVWSHVGFIVRLDSIDRVLLLESVEPIGVRTVRLSKYLENYANDGKPYPGGLAIIRHADFEDAAKGSRFERLFQYAVDRFGYPYDKDEIAKIAARIMASKIPFTPKQMKKIKPDEEFICSEYVARCYEKVGIEIEWNEKGFISPADFAADPKFELVAVLKR